MMIKQVLQGIKAYAGGFALISKLKLWKFFFVPMLISVLTATIIGVSAYGLSDNIGALISKIWVWDTGKETFTTIASVLGGIIIIAIGLILYKHIVMALSAPFMSPVSENIEAYLSGNKNVHMHRNTNFKQQLWRGIKINSRNLMMELFLTIPALLFGLVPVVGVISTVLLFLIQAYYAGFGNIDYTLERHYNYTESIRFVRKNKGMAIGNGIVFMLFLLIPVIGIIIVLPLSVTAASLETVKKIDVTKQV